jgi:hypothetical protein
MTLPLALFASSYNDDDVSGTTIQNSKSSYIDGGRNKNMYSLANNGSNIKNKGANLRKTIKQKPSTPNESKLSALLKSMDESSDNENDNDNGDMGDESTSRLSNFVGLGGSGGSGGSGPIDSKHGYPPLPQLNYKGPNMSVSGSGSNPSNSIVDTPISSNYPVTPKDYNDAPSSYANQYYKQFVPQLNQGSGYGEMPEESKSNLIEKLNYIIDLLEEQQDYKTNSILEDLILYTFLGIFVIFIVDSFARSGKYVR